MALSLTFHGAAGTVTGSCFRLRTPHGEVLVECGLFQGTKTVRELNYRPFPFDPARIRAVLLTHAHIDHSGLLPKLVKLGFRGRIHATPATVDLLEFMLPDSAYIQEVEVDHLNRRNRQRGRPTVQPIYTREDAARTLARLKPADYDDWIDVIPGVRARFWQAGHLLGSASVEVEIREGKGAVRVLFSGDVGPGGKRFHADAEGPTRPDWLVLETTYGDRERADVDEEARQTLLRNEVRAALDAGGNLLIPVFAVERTQELLYDLNSLFDQGRLPPADVFLDSPLASAVTGVFSRHLRGLNGGADPFARPNLHIVESVEQSKRLNALAGGAIIMAASGMCDAGRIRHHLKNQLWHSRCTVLLVGYQAPGTLGRMLLNGVKRVRIHGEEVEVRARIRSLDVYSGHADRSGLLAWAAARGGVGQGTFLVHGEGPARAAIRDALIAQGWDADGIAIPDLDETVDLTARRPHAITEAPARLPASAVAATSDWHNRYAETVLSLAHTLDTAPDDATRDRILAQVRSVLGGGTDAP
ncbi:MBL fold metallo-hydrolase [Azospirillum sp.]|uniref:MBL fold metallo-hydrolase n=1 Tax=Azospirillum sp. TaxID=34012 RepID=UPI003D71C4BE